MIKEIQDLLDCAKKLSEREMREQELLVAQFILKHPDIPIEQIALVHQTTCNGISFWVTTRDELALERKKTEEKCWEWWH